jgi:hypothetical protein
MVECLESRGLSGKLVCSYGPQKRSFFILYIFSKLYIRYFDYLDSHLSVNDVIDSSMAETSSMLQCSLN